jgi:hypothetical protein
MVGTEEIEGRRTYVINVIPKRREKYLMEGRIWVDATDYALVRAEGKPAHAIVLDAQCALRAAIPEERRLLVPGIDRQHY